MHRSLSIAILRRLIPLWLGGLLLMLSAAPAFACEVTTPLAVNLGTFSPAAIQASAPFAKTQGGFRCTGFTALTVLSGNYLKATIPSGTVLKLTSAAAPGDSVTYKLFADAAATTEIKPGVDAFYMKSSGVNLLTLNAGTIDVPLYARLASTAAVAPGTYTGTFTVKWDWNLCNGVALLGGCLGTTDSDIKSSTVTVTLTVLAKPPLVSIAFGPTTWDPVNGTNNPRKIPGGKKRVLLTLSNPDIVATTAGGIAVSLPTPPGMAIALEGDGKTTGAAIVTTDGSPSSGVTMSYQSASSTTDQVDFSNDGGKNWTYYPVAGTASQTSVTDVRFRPQGAMAAGTSYTISVPYSLR